MGKLAPRFCASATPGKYGDGDGLWLIVKTSKRAGRLYRKTWVFRYTWQSRVTETGLGRYPEIGLAEAREKALEGRRLVAKGINPAEARKAAAKPPSTPSFGEVADKVLSAKGPAWRSDIHKRQWEQSVRTHLCRADMGSVNQRN